MHLMFFLQPLSDKFSLQMNVAVAAQGLSGSSASAATTTTHRIQGNVAQRPGLSLVMAPTTSLERLPTRVAALPLAN